MTQHTRSSLHLAWDLSNVWVAKCLDVGLDSALNLSPPLRVKGPEACTRGFAVELLCHYSIAGGECWVWHFRKLSHIWC